MKAAAILTFYLIHLFIALPLLSQNNNKNSQLLNEAEEYMDQMDEQKALDTYLQILEGEPEHYEALWNASLLYSTIGYRFDEEDKMESYFKNASRLAEKAIELYPNRGHPYYVMAVAKGRMSEVVGTRRRIELSHVVQENISKAVEIIPEHAPSWHLYGVWQSEVANTSRAERLAANLISGGIPDASNEKAEEYIKRAIELDPNHIIFHFDLAQHYIRKGEEQKAIPILEKIVEMEPHIKDDQRHLHEAQDLLSEIN